MRYYSTYTLFPNHSNQTLKHCSLICSQLFGYSTPNNNVTVNNTHRQNILK